MNELDEFWQNRINEAAAAAKSSGRSDVADYLLLKASNDTLRSTSIQWLFEAAREIAAENNRINAAIITEEEHPHNFPYKNANLVGSLIRFRQGLRCLTVEAGWTRTPNDGFMRGGALAAARISHFGLTDYNCDLILLRLDNAPTWFAVSRNETQTLFDSRNLRKHFQLFLDLI